MDKSLLRRIPKVDELLAPTHALCPDASTAAVTAARINAAAREDVSFRYTAEQGKTVTVTAEGAGSGTSQKTGSEEVTLYTTGNGYDYYTYTTSSGVTP